MSAVEAWLLTFAFLNALSIGVIAALLERVYALLKRVKRSDSLDGDDWKAVDLDRRRRAVASIPYYMRTDLDD